MRELTLGDPRRSADRDADLVEALRRQETGAIEALIALFGDRVSRLAMRITGNRPDAEEVVQDAFWTVSGGSRRSEVMRPSAPGSIASPQTARTRNFAFDVRGIRRVGWTKIR
jgi:hypothetical protein